MNKKSFTLIELLVVIAIIGILSSLVIARFSNWNDNARIANTLQWSVGTHRKLGANLVGHWNFDEESGPVFKDLSGRNNNGQGVGGYARSSTTPNKDGFSLDLGATDAYVNVPNSDTLNIRDNITVSAWIKMNSLTGSYNSIVLKGDGGWQYYWLHIRNGMLRGYVIANGSGYHALSPSLVPINTWVHALFSYDGSNIRLYENGKMVGSSAAAGSINTTTASLKIGREQEWWGENLAWNFDGSIDDVRIYDTALTAEEIGRIYAETKDSYLAYE